MPLRHEHPPLQILFQPTRLGRRPPLLRDAVRALPQRDTLRRHGSSGIRPVRFSAGCDDSEDPVADLRAALDAIAG